MLRLAGGLSTQRSSAFAIARNIQQIGGTLSSWGDREFVGYTVTTSADNVETGLKYLQDLVQPAFKPWELSDNAKTIHNQLDSISKEVCGVFIYNLKCPLLNYSSAGARCGAAAQGRLPFGLG